MRCYRFIVNFHRRNGSCDSFDDKSGKVCVPNETENVNINVFDMIAVINESKTLAKHKSCECKCKFDGRKCNLNKKR